MKTVSVTQTQTSKLNPIDGYIKFLHESKIKAIKLKRKAKMYLLEQIFHNLRWSKIEIDRLLSAIVCRDNIPVEVVEDAVRRTASELGMKFEFEEEDRFEDLYLRAYRLEKDNVYFYVDTIWGDSKYRTMIKVYGPYTR